MKNVVIAVLFLTMFQVAAQNEIQTTVIKGDQLIDYAADNFPVAEAQQLYLLVETGSAGISQESTFYIEKGVELLLKRLGEEDQIAIGVYGAANGTVLGYTAVQSKEVILEKVARLFKGTFAVEATDGIDLAYELAESERLEESISTVVMLRGTAKRVGNATHTVVKNAYLTSAGADVHTAQASGNNQEKAPREQAKAAKHVKLGGAIALTALTILPELIDIIKD